MTKKYLITGASSGIGRATAERLLSDGCQVVGVARDFSKFTPEDSRFTTVAMDLADLRKLPDRLKALAAEHCDIDGIVFCAGQGRFGKLEQFSYAQISELMDLNFTANAYLARAFLPPLKKQGHGDLIFIGSEAALAGKKMGSVYCASKFALRGFAQALREECAAAGVGVCIINPGMVRTEFFASLDFQPGPDDANFVEPEDVANAIAMVLASRQGTVFDEINLSPQKRVVAAKKKGEGR